MINVTPVILCGDSGTRLWPLSGAGFPKQFLVLSGTTSLFQQAVEPVNQLGASDISVCGTFVVTNEEHRFLSLEQLREIKGVNATLLPWLHYKPPKAGKTLFWLFPLLTKLCKTPQRFNMRCSRW